MEENVTDVKPPLSYGATVTVIGLFGGVFWGAIFQLFAYFNFTEVGPTFIIRSWIKADFAKGWMGVILSLVCLSIISLLFAYLYSILFRKFNSYWLGVGYGLVLWALIFLVLRPLFPGMKTVMELSINTIITTICLFLLFGLFIGYSISFEYHEEQLEKKARAEKNKAQV
ncbi:YqhR family membrane protein [Pradoshia sp.]